MNISSVVIRCHPQQLSDLRNRLEGMAGIEVHGEHPEGRLVITLEDTDVACAADSYVELHDVPGVLSATLIYQYGDDELASPTTDRAASGHTRFAQQAGEARHATDSRASADCPKTGATGRRSCCRTIQVDHEEVKP